MSKSRRPEYEDYEEDNHPREPKRRREKKITSHNYEDFLDDEYDDEDSYHRR